MAEATTYQERRGEIEAYFDRTAAETWARLTSDAPVSGIRATVREGRDRMRAMLLSWLPADLSGLRLLDAGCGTGAFTVEAARRGATVVAIDLSPNLVEVAKERLPDDIDPAKITWASGDMLDPALGRFDHVVAMDSVIHYEAEDKVEALAKLAERTDASLLFTFAPRTKLLSVKHAVGKLFPRGDRAPAIEPVSEERLRAMIGRHVGFDGMKAGRSELVQSGFYTSRAMELHRV